MGIQANLIAMLHVDWNRISFKWIYVTYLSGDNYNRFPKQSKKPVYWDVKPEPCVNLSDECILKQWIK